MADRMKALAGLGVLLEEAEARGDLRAVERLNLALSALSEAHTLASLVEQRRSADAARKRPPRKSEDPQSSKEIPGNPRSSESAYSVKATTTTTTTQHTPREAVRLSAADIEAVDAMTGEVARAVGPEHWPAVDRFLKRRDVSTWVGWTREMLKMLTGSQFTAGDLAQVCDDDAALGRPIGSPFALRKFLQSARQERMADARGETSTRPPRRGGVAQRTWDNGVAALKDL
jgi:hypothetical protein